MTATALSTSTMVKDVLATMAPGQEFIYHTGSLMYDRSNIKNPAWMTIHEAAKLLWEAYERGEVTLLQRKIGTLRHEYICIKRTPRPKKRRPQRTEGVTATVMETPHATPNHAIPAGNPAPV